MTFKYSMKIRNARLNAIADAVGASPILRLFARREPPLCGDADPAGMLLEMELPQSWLVPASNASITMDGVWEGRAADVGIVRSFRIYDAKGQRCHLQGSVSRVGDGGDMVLSETSLVPSQTVTIEQFQIVSANGATVIDKSDLPLPKQRVVQDGESRKFKHALKENNNATR